MSNTTHACPLCAEVGGLLIVERPQWRVVRVADADFPAFYRVIWQPHVAEFSDLELAARSACMEVVYRVEQLLRQALAPAKINLASLGNMVPHLHWHVVARFDWDSHFPNPIWGERQRTLATPAEPRLPLPLARLDDQLRAALLFTTR